MALARAQKSYLSKTSPEFTNDVFLSFRALREVADLAGLVLRNEADGHEAKRSRQKTLRQEMEPESAGSSTSKVQELVFRPPSHAFDSALIITEAEKVLERLEDIVKQKEQYLGLEASTGHKRLRQATTRETSSLVDDSGVYGRDQDKEAIVKLLLSNDDAAGKEISVIPIIGMGGMGKTTLAQLVYNDIRVKQHFELQAWVCISDVEFDVTRITQTIYESVTGNTYCGIAKLDLLQNKLKGELMMKRFLLVLDDVWNENYMEWDKLRQPFESGAFGSKIIVTARNQRVASAMCALPRHHLMPLSDEDCWLLFSRHAFGNADLLNYPHRDLASIGRQIATKCKGLPLAANLSELHIEGAKVESVGLKFYGCGVKPFRSLNELSFVDMLEWQEWFCDVDEEGEIFPNLCNLTLKSSSACQKKGYPLLLLNFFSTIVLFLNGDCRGEDWPKIAHIPNVVINNKKI
ncbi:hypothetical protein M0R45_001548 [Rubus argutus]|uniref:NB-ARC domain-containing protein n=1 Tax=Rubus argutus TaxID=59490 RepID=A0AAW1VKB5_RUBAR